MPAGCVAYGEKYPVMKIKICLILVSVLVLGACSEFQSFRGSGFAPVVTGGHSADNWLAELHATRSMTPQQLHQELGSRQHDFRYKPSTGNRLRLVLLLTFGGESVRDTGRARQLLEELDTPPDSPGGQELVAILKQFLDEKKIADKKLKVLSRQVSKQNTRIEELEEQQKALTTIEQSIQQREIPVENPSGN
jgi:hypothetical protein